MTPAPSASGTPEPPAPTAAAPALPDRGPRVVGEPPQAATLEATAPPAAADAAPTAEADASPEPPDREGAEKWLVIGGRLSSYIRASLTDVDAPLQQVSSSLWLDANARMTTGTFAKVSLAGDVMTPSSAGRLEGRARVREAYAGGHVGGFEARVGQQILAWGNADGIHAIDLLTASDYSFFSVSGDAKQIGAPSVLLSLAPLGESSALRFTAVWQPVAPSSRVLVPKSAVPPNARLVDEDRLPLTLASSEAAAKIAYSPGGWDVALVGFHGWNHIAEPYPGAIREGVVEVGRRHHPCDALGVQASAALDAWVLRLEGAYVVTDNPSGRDRLVQPSHVDAVIGVEHPLGDRMRISAQGVARWHPRYVPLDAPYDGAPQVAFANRAVAAVNAKLLNYTHPIRPGASLALSYASEDESFEASVAALGYFVGFDWVVQPMVGYRFLGAVKFDVGVQLFGGEKNSLGFLSSQSGAFAQSTYTF